MSLQLRDYQIAMYDQMRELRRKGARSMICQSPTGSGKTVLAATLLHNCVAKGFTAWFLCHRREILKQSLVKLTEAGVNAGIVASGMAMDRMAPVQVCSIQTLARRHFKLPPPHLIVYDECHHIASNTWAQIHAAYPQAVHVGLSATPQRLDGAGLGRFFEHLLLGPSVRTLIDAGWLSPYRLFAPTRPDLSGVETLAGDYNRKQMSAKMDISGVAGDTVANYKKYVMGQRAIVFMWSVESSIDMAARFNQAGIPAAHIDGETDERTRDRAVEMFRAGSIRVLSQVEICGEGFDLPSCSAGFFCRPTQSLTMHLQQIGRCLRPEPGKVAYLFDQASNTLRLGLPDDEDHKWSLETTKKKKKKETEAKLRVCPQCTEVHSMNVRVCGCGCVLVNAREMIVDEERELSEIDIVAIKRERLNEQSRAKDLESLVAVGRARGHRNPEAWARMLFRAREEKKARIAAEKAQKRPIDQPVTEEVQEQWMF